MPWSFQSGAPRRSSFQSICGGCGRAPGNYLIAPGAGLRYNLGMFATAQLEMAFRKLQGMARPVVLRLDPGPNVEDKLAEALCKAAEQIALAGGDRVLLERASKPSGPHPVLEVKNVRYRAVPFGPEMEPFLDLLVRLSLRELDPVPSKLAPATVQVLMAPTCPHCPQTVSACIQVAVEHPQVTLEVIDAQYYQAEVGRVKAVPTVVVDGGRTVVGTLRAEELLAILQERSDESYLLSTITSMLETGRLSDAAPLLRSPGGQEALCSLFAGSTMHQRIGLVLVAEEALASDPHALDGAVPCLLPLLYGPDDSLRGDTADLLGRIGAPGARDALTHLLRDTNPDLREVASESLSMLREPS